MKGRVGQALLRTAAVAAAGTALARRAARRGDGTIRQLGSSGLALREEGRQGRRRGLWQLSVNMHSGELIAEVIAALKRTRRGVLGRREGCSEVGTRRWAALRDVRCSARSRRGASLSRMHRERERGVQATGAWTQQQLEHMRTARIA